MIVVVDDKVVVEVVISIVGSPDGCNCSILSFILIANLVGGFPVEIETQNTNKQAYYI